MIFNLQSILQSILNQIKLDSCLDFAQILLNPNLTHMINGIDFIKVSINCRDFIEVSMSKQTSPTSSSSMSSGNKSAVYLFLTSDSVFSSLIQALDQVLSNSTSFNKEKYLEILKSTNYISVTSNSCISYYYVIYVGQTDNMERRLDQFKRCLEASKESCGHTFAEKLKILFQQSKSLNSLDLYVLVFYISVSIPNANVSNNSFPTELLKSLSNEFIRKALEECFIEKWRPIFNFIKKGKTDKTLKI